MSIRRRQVILLLFALLLAFPASARAAQLMLSWTDNASDEDGFLVERRESATPTFTQVAFLGPNAAGYMDDTVRPGQSYCYRVRAVNRAGASAYTSDVCGTATGTAPLPLSVSLNQPTFRQADTLVATVHAVAGIVSAPIDAYEIEWGIATWGETHRPM